MNGPEPTGEPKLVPVLHVGTVKPGWVELEPNPAQPFPELVIGHVVAAGAGSHLLPAIHRQKPPQRNVAWPLDAEIRVGERVFVREKDLICSLGHVPVTFVRAEDAKPKDAAP